MKNTKIVNLGQVRNLLTLWEAVRSSFKSGKYKGFQLTLIGEDNRDTVFVGGVYQEEPLRAVSAMLKSSAARMAVEDEPMKEASEFRISQFA